MVSRVVGSPAARFSAVSPQSVYELFELRRFQMDRLLVERMVGAIERSSPALGDEIGGRVRPTLGAKLGQTEGDEADEAP